MANKGDRSARPWSHPSQPAARHGPPQGGAANRHQIRASSRYVVTESLRDLKDYLQPITPAMMRGEEDMDEFTRHLDALHRKVQDLLLVKSNHFEGGPGQTQTRDSDVQGLFYGRAKEGSISGFGNDPHQVSIQEKGAPERVKKNALGHQQAIISAKANDWSATEGENCGGQHHEPNWQKGVDIWALQDHRELEAFFEQINLRWSDLRQHHNTMYWHVKNANDHLQHATTTDNKQIGWGTKYSDEDDWQRMHQTIQKEKADLTYQVESLKEKLWKAEEENSKARGGSHSDNGALPPRLNGAATDVKMKLMNFAKTVGGFGNRLELPDDEGHNSRAVIGSTAFENESQRVRYRTAYVTSILMFRGFEIDGFDSTKDYFCVSLDPEDSASACFKEFQTLEQQSTDPSFQHQVEEVVKVNAAPHGDRFQRFAWQKFRDVVPGNLLEEAIGMPGVVKMFVRLAIAVWQMQRLAFSFHPNAKILRVRCGAEFDDRYMEEIVDEEPGTAPPRVAFMVVPGFRLGKIIVKSEVYTQRGDSSKDEQDEVLSSLTRTHD